MNTEDLLRAALRSRAAEVEPDPSALEGLGRRVAAARRRRRRVRLAVAVLAAGALAAAALTGVVVRPRDGGQRRIAAGPLTAGGPGATVDDLPPLYPGGDRGAPTAEAAALGFAKAIGMPPDTVVVHGNDEAVEVRPSSGGPVTRVLVQRRGGGWFAVGARSATIVLDAPGDGAGVRAPVRLRGRASAFEGTVNVALKRYPFATPASEPELEVLPPYITTGADGEPAPFDATVDFDLGLRGPVALVLFELDAGGGGRVLTATVVRVTVEAAGDARLVEPGEMVAWLGPRLVVVRPDGSVGRQLFESAKGPPGGIPVSAPDGRSVFTEQYDYGPTGGSCGTSIVRITRPVGGKPEVVATGWSPALDPTGRFLAHAACDNSVHIRNLCCGDERAIGAIDAGGLTAAPAQLVWSPDGRALAVQVGYENGSEVVVLDVGARSLGEGRKVAGGSAVLLAGWSGERVAVATGGGDVMAFGPGGEGRAVLFEGLPTGLRSVRLDSEGTALVAVDADGVLWAAARGESPRRLGAGYVSAGW